MRFVVIPSLLVLLAACASVTPERSSGVCETPRLVASDLIVGDGLRDRGFPGGVSLADVDNDGDLDLMATGGYSPVANPTPPHYTYRANVLYLNDGKGNFTHGDQTAFTADNPHSGSTWADIDNDGDLDAFVGVQHGRPDIFYRNMGDGRLAREQLGEATTTAGSNFSASWVDIDNDGDLDLVSGGPTLEMPAPLLIYRNDGGNFVRVTETPLENGASNGGALLWSDYDNDGDVDLFVANSDIARRSGVTPAAHEGSQLYRNDGGWTFVRTEGQAFSDVAHTAVGATAGDLDGDGDLDLYISQFAGPDRIFLNDGVGRFALDSRFTGLEHEELSTAAAFGDADGDGDLDLVQVAYGEGVGFWINDGTGGFTRSDDQALAARTRHYWGAASGDIDNDGDVDFVLGSWGETADGEYITLLRNQSTLCGRPLRIELRNRYGAPDPLGTRVTLITRGPNGERRQLREAMGQSSMRSQSGSAFLFSVPRGERVVAAEVRWPDGQVETLRRPRHGVVVRDSD